MIQIEVSILFYASALRQSWLQGVLVSEILYMLAIYMLGKCLRSNFDICRDSSMNILSQQDQ